MLIEIEEESEMNRKTVTDKMTSLRQLIIEQEQNLLQNIEDTKKEQKKSVEDYKRLIQNEQQNLIEQILDFVIISKDNQPNKLLNGKSTFQDYINKTHQKLIQLKPLTRNKKYLSQIDKLKDIENQIKNIKLENINEYQNPKLLKQFIDHGNNPILNLTNQQLNNLDMEIVANQLEINKVK